ncbi:hypothetical protein M427DRAFT_437907 [Gonapodya prolifera JEL478]|uniref:Calcium channel YVC1-like C-terminal transmembrane domain-containing protein n=1 Tax=Gonapodya prolifera (strain JEL478) TaxID=1344416 RepID=A0A139A3W2_GONPJ|nr:hypothetical protein M427DRAFT_437907 [Gonapodya prolifera JEL478]|eukprot:KXS11481.1 hypothetical protein M427DRAFT_437907 [Gonapodya prolifera JEL478]
MFASDLESKLYFNDHSYDIFAVASPFVWIRAVHVFSGYRIFSNIIIVVRSLLRDAAIFFVLLGFVLIGFVQGFVGLDPSRGIAGFGQALMFAIRGLLQDPNFDEPREFHPLYGPFLMVVYLFFTGTMMLNLLIALFNLSISNILGERADQEYAVAMAVRTVAYFKFRRIGSGHPLFPPFNLLRLILVVPIHTILFILQVPKVKREPFIFGLNRILVELVYFPFELFTWLYLWARHRPSSKNLGDAERKAVKLSQVTDKLKSEDSEDASEKRVLAIDKIFVELQRLTDKVDKLEQVLQQGTIQAH